jgi:hypothetical protein
VVLDASDGDRVHAMSSCDARHVRPQFRLERFGNYLEAVFRAEHEMDVVAYVAAGHCAVPFGTRLTPNLPGTAVPGYRLFRPFGTGLLGYERIYTRGRNLSKLRTQASPSAAPRHIIQQLQQTKNFATG